MTLFTDGRLQAYERMMQDTGRHHGHRDDEESNSGKKKQPQKKETAKAGDFRGSIQS